MKRKIPYYDSTVKTLEYQDYYPAQLKNYVEVHGLSLGQILARWLITEQTFMNWLMKHEELAIAFDEVRGRIPPVVGQWQSQYQASLHPKLYEQYWKQGLNYYETLDKLNITHDHFRIWTIYHPAFREMVKKYPRKGRKDK